ncbi:MAG: DUF3231 family protein [Halanaerobium sp.]|nr:DUF3231 family protein [Halanaerobium sp.]
MGLFSDKVMDEPLHFGEIYYIWEHLMKAKGCMSKFQLLKNHTEDQELRDFIADMNKNLIETEIKYLDEVLLENGIETPPDAKDVPLAETNSIPTGARFTDMEVASCIANDLKTAMTSTSMIIGLSTNDDITKFFAQHHNQLVKFGGILLKMMKKNCWLIKPPVATAALANTR